MLFFLLAKTTAAQTTVEGYVFEENNRGYLRQVKLTVLELPGNIVRAEMESNAEGYFATALAPGEYLIQAQKDVFHNFEEKFSAGAEKVFLKIEMQRRPGYLFDVTVSEARSSPEVVVDAVQGATIEIFNRTQNRPELVLKQHPEAFFQHTFEQGNHYTILIRKPGFLAKRIEVYVNVKGCILCVDGARDLTPGITENLTAKNTMGTLLTNIELEPAKLDRRIQIQNIYYDFDKWDIRPDAAERLDVVVTLMNDNPGLSVELGSHTDSRGNDDYNQELSQKRAAAAVAYIVSEGVDSARITAKGYGESQLVNRCRNGAICSEEEHQQNRRTELRITGVSGDSLEYLRWPSLEQIVQEEEVAKAKKDKKRAQKSQGQKLPEANNSVPLPEIITVPTLLPLPLSRANDSVPLPEIITVPTLLPRANDSVPLPEIITTEKVKAMRTEARLQSGAPSRPLAQPQPTRPIEVATKQVKKVDKNYSGFMVELVQADTLLADTASVFAVHTDIFWQKDDAGKFCYFTGGFDTPTKVRRFFQQSVRPNNAAARMVRFDRGKKTYFE